MSATLRRPAPPPPAVIASMAILAARLEALAAMAAKKSTCVFCDL